jgi:putative transposase
MAREFARLAGTGKRGEGGDLPRVGNVNPAVGIDAGLEHFLSTSEGEHIPNPRFLKTELPALLELADRLAGRNSGRTAARGR